MPVGGVPPDLGGGGAVHTHTHTHTQTHTPWAILSVNRIEPIALKIRKRSVEVYL